jgi:hypothetical protein
MAVFTIKSFGGIAPKIPARYLQDSQAQTALNCPVFTGSIQPLADVGAAVHSVAAGTKTIYRFGQDTISDSEHWFEWDKEVDVVRGQIAADTSEWTFYSGDGGPKATYNAIALSAAGYPALSRPLGLPAPATAPTALPVAKTATGTGAEITLTASDLDLIVVPSTFKYSTTGQDDADYSDLSVTANDATSMTTLLDGVSGLTAVENGDGSVTVTNDTVGSASLLHVKYQTGSIYDEQGAFTYDGVYNKFSVGTSDTDPMVILEDSEIGAIGIGDVIEVITETSTAISQTVTGSSVTAASFEADAAILGGSKLSVVKYGSCIVITGGLEGTGKTGSITYRRTNDQGDVAYEVTSDGADAAGQPFIIVDPSDVASVAGKYLSVTVNGTETKHAIGKDADISTLGSLVAFGCTVTTYGDIDPFAIIKSNSVGTSATLRLQSGTFPSEPFYSVLSSTGFSDDDGVQETRIYAWTWVNKESGFEFESAPSPAANAVDVYPSQNVELTDFAAIPSADYIVTHRRIYRSTAGVFLYVGEMDVADTTFTDSVDPESLGEEMASLYWAEPPEDLAGLTNLPNGIVAGFVGRDVYMCDPYHPHAWPETYINTIDYPVVGFGRMDTTLAVLTTGTPYFIQGSHPDSMAVVKSDLEQACVSKRSIVSYGGVVMYAAPDGLMLLSPGGSKIVTEQLFNFKQWQTYFKPETIHAYQHDNQYIGFFDNGVNTGGFTFDITSGQFILHDIYCESAYHDLVQDKLYLVFADGSIKVWGQGAPKNYIWRSKKFTLPAVMGFSCAQLEAEAYPMTMKIFVDGTLKHTQTVTSRDPFRLPSGVGRDYELQVEGNSEVFSMAVAHSMSELANG